MSNTLLKIYKDIEMKNQVIGDTLDLGIGKAGYSNEYVFYVYNDSRAEFVDLELKVGDEEVNVASFPEVVKPWSREKFKLVWKPSADIEQPLRSTFRITGKKLFRP